MIMAGLAVAALRHVAGRSRPSAPCAARRSAARPFDGGDLLVPTASLTVNAAGAHRDAVDMHGAGAALCNAAAVFGAGQSDILPDRPQQRRVVLDVDVVIVLPLILRFAIAFPEWSNPPIGLRGDVGLEAGTVQIKNMRLQRGRNLRLWCLVAPCAPHMPVMTFAVRRRPGAGSS